MAVEWEGLQEDERVRSKLRLLELPKELQEKISFTQWMSDTQKKARIILQIEKYLSLLQKGPWQSSSQNLQTVLKRLKIDETWATDLSTSIVRVLGQLLSVQLQWLDFKDIKSFQFLPGWYLLFEFWEVPVSVKVKKKVAVPAAFSPAWIVVIDQEVEEIQVRSIYNPLLIDLTQDTIEKSILSYDTQKREFEWTPVFNVYRAAVTIGAAVIVFHQQWAEWVYNLRSVHIPGLRESPLEVDGTYKTKGELEKAVFEILEKKYKVTYNPETKTFTKEGRFRTIRDISWFRLNVNFDRLSYQDYLEAKKVAELPDVSVEDFIDFKKSMKEVLFQEHINYVMEKPSIPFEKWLVLNGKLTQMWLKVGGKALHVIMFPIFYRAYTKNPLNYWGIARWALEHWSFWVWASIGWRLPLPIIWKIIAWMLLWGLTAEKTGEASDILWVPEFLRTHFPNHNELKDNSISLEWHAFWSWLWPDIADKLRIDLFPWLALIKHTVDLSTDSFKYIREWFWRNTNDWNDRLQEFNGVFYASTLSLFQQVLSWKKIDVRWSLQDILFWKWVDEILPFHAEIGWRIIRLLDGSKDELIELYKKSPNLAYDRLVSLVNHCSYQIEKLKIDQKNQEYYKYYEAHIANEEALDTLAINWNIDDLRALSVSEKYSQWRLFIANLITKYKSLIPKSVDAISKLNAWEISENWKKIFLKIKSIQEKYKVSVKDEDKKKLLMSAQFILKDASITESTLFWFSESSLIEQLSTRALSIQVQLQSVQWDEEKANLIDIFYALIDDQSVERSRWVIARKDSKFIKSFVLRAKSGEKRIADTKDYWNYFTQDAFTDEEKEEWDSWYRLRWNKNGLYLFWWNGEPWSNMFYLWALNEEEKKWIRWLFIRFINSPLEWSAVNASTNKEKVLKEFDELLSQPIADFEFLSPELKAFIEWIMNFPLRFYGRLVPRNEWPKDLKYWLTPEFKLLEKLKWRTNGTQFFFAFSNHVEDTRIWRMMVDSMKETGQPIKKFSHTWVYENWDTIKLYNKMFFPTLLLPTIVILQYLTNKKD